MTGAQAGWAGFWGNEPAAEGGATLAQLPPELEERLDGPWDVLAARLPSGARVLDLATGGGVVLERLHARRADLKLVGVDAAPQLPKRPGMELKAGIATDRLPFADASFDAVTSRFGIEYGPLQAGAGEAARVLRPGGQLCLVVHHAGSKVLRHNRARREALHWAAHESGHIEKALNFARTRMMMALPVPSAFRAAARDATARFPGQSAAWEFLTGLAQVLEAVSPPATEAAVRELRTRADGEIARLDALMAAACDGSRLAGLMEALEAGGVRLDPAAVVEEPDGAPLAWLIEGQRA